MDEVRGLKGVMSRRLRNLTDRARIERTGELKGAYGAHSNRGAAAFVPMHGEPCERPVCSS